jgi:ribulose-phosphate 3-epimerase
MVQIAVSLLAADFSRLADDIRKVEKQADMLHIDVMDGHFVPNITFGVPVVAAIRKITKLPLDVHLMITEPEKYVDAFCEAGADSITVHAEATGSLPGVLKAIRKKGVRAAVALKPSTPLSAVSSVLGEIDMLLIMSVNPGFGGQQFMESVLTKISEAKEIIRQKRFQAVIEVDGGITGETAKKAISAGADVLVAGSFIYRSKDIEKAIAALRE